MRYEELFNDVKRIFPKVYSDTRGSFSEDYNYIEFEKIGIKDKFVQDNISISSKKNTIRGLHFQSNPFSQSKMIKVIRGSIFDVFVDLRKQSNTYEQFHHIELYPDEGWIYIPEGFAHGFCTLEDETIVLYKVNDYYSLKNDGGIKYDDPSFSIPWPLFDDKPILSDKDIKLPNWKEIKNKVNF